MEDERRGIFEQVPILKQIIYQKLNQLRRKSSIGSYDECFYCNEKCIIAVSKKRIFYCQR